MGNEPTFWTPAPVWQGQDALVIGGGPSLATFPFYRVRNQNIVGCNYGYRLTGLLDYLFFYDGDFFVDKWKEIQQCGAKLVSCNTVIVFGEASGVHTMRQVYGRLGQQEEMGWWGNSGIGAVVLAHRLGAKRIFMIGMDATKNERTPNDYSRFIPGWVEVSRLLRSDGKTLINVTDESGIPKEHIARMTVNEYLEQLK